MPKRKLSTTNIICLALLTGAGLAFSANAALAQDDAPYGPPPGYQNAPPPGYGYGPPTVQEEVPVIAPALRGETRPLGAPPGRVSTSTVVHYGDLDLTTRYGARALRMRVRQAAHDVCAQLADVYPVYQLNGTSCYKTAVDDALIRVDEAVSAARREFRYNAGYYPY